MKYEMNNTELTIYLSGRISSDNSMNLEKEIQNTIADNSHTKLYIDADELEYISSAGLRILIKLAKTEKGMKIVNVSRDVFDIFEVTGMNKILDISRKRRKISLENAQLIGSGFFSNVYRLDKDTIVKVFIRDTDFDNVEREMELCKSAFLMGVPTAISYDIIEADGKPGAVFEMLDCELLRDVIVNDREHNDMYIKKYAGLVRELGKTDVGDSLLPSAKQVAIDKFKTVSEYLDKSENEKLRIMLENIPDKTTFVHGDCQIKNIMVREDEMLLIDMDTLSYGDPLFELASMYACYEDFIYANPVSSTEFLGLSGNEESVKIYEDIHKYYFEGLSKEDSDSNYSKIELFSAFHMVWWITVNKAFEDKKEYFINKLKNQLKEVDNLIIKYNDDCND